MTTDKHQATEVAQRYIAVWNEADPARRLALLEANWTADASYVDPIGKASGRDEINAMVGAVQARFPGFRFQLLGNADAHGEHLRFSWTLGPESSQDLIQGTDFAQLAAGRLHAVTGFLDKVPAAA